MRCRAKYKVKPIIVGTQRRHPCRDSIRKGRKKDEGESEELVQKKAMPEVRY